MSVYDEGLLLGQFHHVNFVGLQVFAQAGATPGYVNVYVPTPSWLSHWNTSDGSNGSQAVTESGSRVNARISTPSGGEGTPFRTGGWAGSVQPASLSGTVVFTTPGSTTGFGGNSSVTVTVYDADGTTVLDSANTGPVSGNMGFTSGSGSVTVTVTGYGPDFNRFQAKVSVSVDAAAILAAAGRQGGRYHVRVTHSTDSVTDGSGPYHYDQPDVFLDSNPTTPSMPGGLSVSETLGFVATRHLSGIEYYTIGSRFTVLIPEIDQLNRNAQRSPSNLRVDGPEYGLPALDHAPYGAGSGNFSGWTNLENVDDVSYANPAWTVSVPNHRYMGPSGSVSGYARDPWNDSSPVAPSIDADILVDTWGTTSTALVEDFDDEARREDPASFPGVGSWNSSSYLVAGEALVYNSRLMVPSSSTFIRPDGPNAANADWTFFKPDISGPNPNYTLLGAPAKYGRRFTKAPGLIPSFSFVFAGTFAAGSALADLQAGNLEVYVWRIGGLGQVGPPPGNSRPLRAHLPFNFATYDDGATVGGSGIREGSSSGNVVNCTFGTGTPANGGFYCEIRLLNAATSIHSVSVTFY